MTQLALRGIPLPENEMTIMQTWLNLQDKTIIVTGGASGIGLAIVDELLSLGANVQMIDIHGGDKHHHHDHYS